MTRARRRPRRPAGQESQPERRRRRSIDDIIPVPKHPYRDSAIFYAILAVLLVVVASVTGGNMTRAIVFGAGFFVVATAWSWWRFKQRLERERAEAVEAEKVKVRDR
jgi:hypothetical protein